jgi:hemerythrin
VEVEEEKEGNDGFIPWKKAYALGIPLIDEQHRKLLRLTNDLYMTCREGSTSAGDGFKSAARAIAEYIKVHFKTEEKIMERIGFPDLAGHRGEHREFVGKFIEEVRSFEEGKPFVPYSFAVFLKQWILDHVAQTDRKMGRYLLEAARKGELVQGP